MGVDLHGRMNPQPPLEAREIVVSNILPDHTAQLFPAGEPPAIVTLPLQDTPEALHGSIVNTLAYPRHTLGHPSRSQLVMEHPGGVLEPPVTVEQGMSVRVGREGLIQRLIDQRAVIGVPEDKGDDPPVAQVQYGAEVKFMDRWPHIIFELCHISQPLFIGLFCAKLTVQHVFSQILRV